MMALIVLAAVVLVLVGLIAVLHGGLGDEKAKYQYRRKKFFMTKAEHEFYDKLVEAVGDDYRVFAQVHLLTLLDHTVKGQDWRAALAHINRKSVDFVLCDKEHLSPKLAIELDDKSHERPDRQERDREVERILEEAKLPLLRVSNQDHASVSDITQRVRDHASLS